MNTDSNIIGIILGNGFDIAYGFKTKYNDFINSEHFKNLLSQGNNLAKFIYDVNSIQNWVDVEVEIGNYSYKMSQEELSHAEFIEQTKVFKKEYEDLRDALSLYISSLTSGYGNHKKMDNLVDEWFIPAFAKPEHKFYVATFNYHRNDNIAVLNKYKDHLFGTYLNFIHGITDFYSKTPCDIVLGVDEICKRARVPEHSFIVKSYNPHTDCSRFFDTIRLCKKYIIFGCSIGETDHRYFKEIFTQKNKEFLIYGFGNDEICKIKSRIAFICGDYTAFIKNNDVVFEDSTKYSCD
jgi:hypothetical protein